MPPFYRIAEVAFYSMINFLPYLSTYADTNWNRFVCVAVPARKCGYYQRMQHADLSYFLSWSCSEELREILIYPSYAV